MPRHSKFSFLFVTLAFGIALTVFGAWRMLVDTDRPGPDTHTYVRAAHALYSPLALREVRTLGYPIFLRLIMPHVRPKMVLCLQLFAHAASLLVLYFGLTSLGVPAGLSAAALMACVLSNSLVWELHGLVQPDSLALSFSLFSMGSFLLTLCCPRSKVIWALFTLASVSTYHLKPVYCFWLVAFPLLAGALKSPGHAGKVIGALWIPFLLFSSLRAATVGEFSLTSFGAINASGSTAQLLSEDMVDELPERVRPFALRVIRDRSQLKLWSSTISTQAEFFGLPEHPGDDLLYRDFHHSWISPLQKGDRIDFPLMHVQYDSSVWKIVHPNTSEMTDDVVKNRFLREFNWAVIALRPMRYFSWVTQGLLVSLYDTFERFRSLIVVVAILLGGALVGRVPLGQTGARLIGIGAGTFFVPYILTVCIFGSPELRYLCVAQFLIPAFLTSLAYSLARSLAFSFRNRYRRSSTTPA